MGKVQLQLAYFFLKYGQGAIATRSTLKNLVARCNCDSPYFKKFSGKVQLRLALL